MKKQLLKINEILAALLKLENSKTVQVIVFENSSQINMNLEEFLNHYNPEEVTKGHCNLMFRIEESERVVAMFNLNDMINCAGVAVFSGLIVNKHYKNMGISKAITGFIADFARYYGYGMLQAADRSNNEFQKRSFIANKWIIGKTFVNPKTGHSLDFWLHMLNES